MKWTEHSLNDKELSEQRNLFFVNGGSYMWAKEMRNRKAQISVVGEVACLNVLLLLFSVFASLCCGNNNWRWLKIIVRKQSTR